MSILKELLGLTDPDMLFEANVPVELKDVIRFFPNKHKEVLRLHWGHDGETPDHNGKVRGPLVWHGMKFFDEDKLGEAYTKAEKAAKEYINDGYNTDARMDIHAEIDGEEHHDDLSWDVAFKDSEPQECYLGYDPKKDRLYIGFDAWPGEEEFNDAFEKAFEEMTGKEHDMEKPEHDKCFHDAWEEYKKENFGFFGLVFEIQYKDGELEADEALAPMVKGFYQGTYKLFKQQYPNVIDLRLS